jgi:predicted TIM-barrel fold metal-dependent hydrolase
MTNRREFLVAAGALAIASPLAGAQQSATSPGYIDAHVHVWGPYSKEYPLAAGFSEKDMAPPTFTPEELFAHCRTHGVDRIVLIQMNFFGFDNRYMLDAMERHAGVFAGVAVVDEAKADVSKTMKELKAKGVRGFRLYANKANSASWLSSAAMKTMWSCGADEGLSMCLLSDPDALGSIHELCEKFPQTPVVIDHFSRIGMRGAVDSKELDALCRLAKFDKVRVKTSAFYALGAKRAPYTDLGSMIRRLRDEFGSSRLMWASDCPYQVQEGHTYEASISLVRDKLDFLTEEDKAWMLRRTAEEVFFS